MKKALVFALSAALALGTVAPAFAAEGDEPTGSAYEEAAEAEEEAEEAADEDAEAASEDVEAYEAADEEAAEETEEALPALPPAIGKIGYITAYEDHQLTVASLSDEEDIIVLNLSEATVVVDAETGLPAAIADRDSDLVKVYHAVFTTMSIPPQSPALVVAINLPEYSASPHYHVIEAIEVDEESAKITVDNGGLIITLDSETPLTPYLTRQMVTIDTLNVGDTLLFWYEAVAASYPGQTTATRAMWLSAAPADDSDIEVADDEDDYIDVVTLPGDISDIELPPVEAIPLPIEVDPVPVAPYDEYIAIEPISIAVAGTGTMIDGVEFFPVRALAVEAGFDVAWEAATRSALLTSGAITVILADGAANFTVDGESYTLPAAAIIIDDVMYAPYSFFAHLA
ncbi:MAG: copper amine oxidase N-terminal domain-containing protein [Defluviitaleaceae bacterium]|nr:copper amine oxidase N-terminal domain-containing protein [Defluviitaleaceae bacterium]